MVCRLIPTRMLVCTCLLFAGGCGKENAPPPSPPGTESAAQTQPETRHAVAAPETPEAAIQAVVDGMRELRPQAIWEFLPPSYQNDVNSLVHDFAGRMDAELWNRSFRVAQRAVEVLESKQDWILQSQFVQQTENVDSGQLAEHYNAVTALLHTLVHSEAAKLEKLRTLDVGAFVEQTGERLFEDLSQLSKLAPGDPFNAQLKSLAVSDATIVESDGQTATVRLRWAAAATADPQDAGRPTSETVTFVRVEGKWVPQPLADAWPAAIESARRRLSGITAESVADVKPRLLQQLERVEESLARLERAESAEAFDVALQEEALALLEWWTELQAKSRPSITDTAGASVTVVIQAELGEQQIEALAARLQVLADDLNADIIGPDVSDGKTTAIVSPVADIETFARQIGFGEVSEVDTEARIVTVKWAAE